MSRTLGAIITLAGAVAVNVIPGLGQLASAAILIGSAAAGAIVSSLGAPKAPAPEQTQTSIKNPIPARVYANGRRRLYGAYLLYETSAKGNAVDVVALSDSRMVEVLQPYLNDDKVTVTGGFVQKGEDDRYQDNRLRMGWNVGLPVETAFSPVVTELPGIWTSNHRGDGIATAYLIKYKAKERDYLTTYPQGDQIQLSIAAKWGLHFDPRASGANAYNKSTWAYSENAAVQFLTYLIEKRGLDWATQGAPQLARITAALNDADSVQPLSAGGSEPRYRGCISYKSTDEPASIIAEFLSAFDGWYCFNERDELILYSGRYYTPTVSLGPNQIVSYRDAGGTPAEDAINEVRVTYVSDAHDYAQVEAQSWRDEDAILESGREPNSTTLDVQSPSYTQNRRLAKRAMARANSSHRFSITTTYGGSTVMGQRFINLRIEEGGFVAYDGPVEITSAPETDMQTGGVTFECAAVDPNIDAWNPATEDGEGAPVGNRIARQPLATPVITNAVAVFDISADNSGTGARISISAESDIEGAKWYARWRVDDGVWNEQEYSDTDPAAGVVTLLTDFVPVVDGVEVSVSYQHPDGRYSAWSPAFDVDTRADQTPPDFAGGVTLVSWSDSISLSTDPIPRASSYLWRFYAPSNLTTPIRTISTPGRTVAYTAAQAELDGVRRDYIVTVAGVNAAGAGPVASTSTITNAAPSKVIIGDATASGSNAQVTFTLLSEPDTAGYSVYYATVTDFDPLTQGSSVDNRGSTPAYIQNLAAGTFYTKVAAYDAWTHNPALLNISDERSFTITTGGGGSGGGGGDGGGGYCPHIDTMLLLANAERNAPGPEKRAGDITVDDWVWTRPELENGALGDWGAYQVSAVELAEQEMWKADIGVKSQLGSGPHRIWMSGWVRLDQIGTQAGRGIVAKITVAGAHTYYGNGLIHHNVKYNNSE